MKASHETNPNKILMYFCFSTDGTRQLRAQHQDTKRRTARACRRSRSWSRTWWRSNRPQQPLEFNFYGGRTLTSQKDTYQMKESVLSGFTIVCAPYFCHRVVFSIPNFLISLLDLYRCTVCKLGFKCKAQINYVWKHIFCFCWTLIGEVTSTMIFQLIWNRRSIWL